MVGLGYVGLPLAVTFAEAGVPVLGLDAVQSKVDQVNAGNSYIEDVPSERCAPLVADGRTSGRPPRGTTCARSTRSSSACRRRSPSTASPTCRPCSAPRRAWPQRLRPGQLVVLESTTYPGTTREELAPVLERGRACAPGATSTWPSRPSGSTRAAPTGPRATTPKVVGGLTPECTAPRAGPLRQRLRDAGAGLSPEVAELTKLLENIFRSVNIALVNELAMLCDRMGIDVWEVIDAAATKPFGFMPFRPGPGLGGHCIPIDPFYLTWKAREFDLHTEFIELAGKVNSQMPRVLRRQGRAGAQQPPQGAQRRRGAGARRRLQGRRRTTRARAPRCSIIELLRGGRRPRRATTTPTSPSWPSSGMRSRAARRGDARGRTTWRWS